MTIGLVIKGDYKAGARELTRRGILAIRISDDAGINEDQQFGIGQVTLAEVSDEALDAITKWFCEKGAPPFPAGTLLFYRHSNQQ